MPEINLKQAWRIPSCEPLPNPNGSAPGWFVHRPDGGIAIALPGPPREMRPMWSDEAMPRLKSRGLGDDAAVRTFRLTGIGESAVAEILGEEMLRRGDPEVATYARARGGRRSGERGRDGRVRTGGIGSGRGGSCGRQGPARRAHLGRRRHDLGRRGRQPAQRAWLATRRRRGRHGGSGGGALRRRALVGAVQGPARPDHAGHGSGRRTRGSSGGGPRGGWASRSAWASAFDLAGRSSLSPSPWRRRPAIASARTPRISVARWGEASRRS